jgi:D-glycero-alpha-D-manno-heptose 1-phosphate guanylyltransferase
MEVIILAGGLGTRLRSVVTDVPKCMAPVAGKPFLGWLLEWLARFPVTRVVLSVGYKREVIQEYVDARDWPFQTDYAVEETPLGTGGGIRLALSHCTEDRVFVLNGDTFFNADLERLVFSAPVTVALKPMRDFDRYGAVTVQRSTAGPTASENYFSGRYPKNQFPEAFTDLTFQITAFREKAPCREGLINGGVYAIDRSRLNLSALPEKFSFEKEVLEPMALKGEVAGQVSDGYFIDIGIPEDYARAQREIPEFQAVLKASDAVLKADADTLFLDRDGVINRWLPGDYVKDWSQFEFLPGIRECLQRWALKYARIVLVTNQRGVGRGLMTDENLADIHARMMEEILRAGGRIDLLLVCTAAEDQDPRRKPNTGMFQEACALFPAIHPGRSVMVGDSEKDALFASRCGMDFILLTPEEVS